MFKRANKPPRRRKGVWFGDNDAEKFDLEASVVINRSRFATTSYNIFDRVQPPQPNNARHPNGHEDVKASVKSTSEPQKARKQVSCPLFFTLLPLNDMCYRVHLL